MEVHYFLALYVGANPCSEQCDSRADCVYDDTGYRCKCVHGFAGNGSPGNCYVPQDGCAVASPCASDARCSVSGNQYHCECKDGYTGDGFTNGSGCISMLTITVCGVSVGD